MKNWCCRKFVALSAGVAFLGGSVTGIHAADLKEAAPPDSFISVYAKHNPERDYQKQYYKEVWETVQQTKIMDRILQIVQSRAGEADAQKFIEIRDTLTNAFAPVEWEKLMDVQEFLFAQRMNIPTSQQLVLARIPDGGAASLKQGIQNLLDLAVQASKGKLTVTTETLGGVEVSVLNLPPQVPLQLIVGASDDLFVFSTSRDFAKSGLELLQNPDSISAFDNERCREALEHLPEAEDTLVFYDGRQMMQQMSQFGSFIRNTAGGNEKANQVAAMVEQLIYEMDGVDYEVTVEYTEGFQNRSASFGRYQSGMGEKVLGQMVQNQQKFEDWKKWVPENVVGFSMTDGCNLHPLYAWIVTEMPKIFPEMQRGLDRFDALQQEHDLYLDEDILQGFGGEFVSLSFPGRRTGMGQSSDGVLFARCNKPERIQELIDRGFNTLTEIPQVRAQGLSLKPVAGMEGFQEVSANLLAMTGARPVFGFHNGWMVVATSPDSVRAALAVQNGETGSFADSEAYAAFNLAVDGPVHSVTYKNVGESIRQMSSGLQQAGMMLPMFIGMAGGQPNGPDLSVVQDIAGLLPSVGRIVGKLDFVDQQLSVCRPGALENSFTRESVTLIRPPKGSEAVDAAPADSTDSK
ncbi:MAG: hypothetical protein KDA91_07475 [Planctomycetaceae bacterium]|nr:hypothetical protein [Planctomycetaceae bacterium]